VLDRGRREWTFRLQFLVVMELILSLAFRVEVVSDLLVSGVTVPSHPFGPALLELLVKDTVGTGGSTYVTSICAPASLGGTAPPCTKKRNPITSKPAGRRDGIRRPSTSLVDRKPWTVRSSSKRCSTPARTTPVYLPCGRRFTRPVRKGLAVSGRWWPHRPHSRPPGPPWSRLSHSARRSCADRGAAYTERPGDLGCPISRRRGP
jgi:hypothetical protein